MNTRQLNKAKTEANAPLPKLIKESIAFKSATLLLPNADSVLAIEWQQLKIRNTISNVNPSNFTSKDSDLNPFGRDAIRERTTLVGAYGTVLVDPLSNNRTI